ncbi:hypothetical protein GC169_09720 [bacterium]|nr:hypothetical protein [bacterium]
MERTALPSELRLRSRALRNRHQDIERAGILSFDVFDTLLLRNLSSEPRRLAAANAMVSGGRALRIARVEAQRIGYAALRGARIGSDIRQDEVIRAAVGAVGGGAELAERLAHAELRVERLNLRPNTALVADIRALRAAGKRVIALSDTMYMPDVLSDLIRDVAGGEVVDHVYTSAELGFTKRGGGAFVEVAAREGVSPERILHFGDDRVADVKRARAAGVVAGLIPRSRLHLIGRKVDTAIARIGAVVTPSAPAPKPAEATPEAYGRDVLGPVLADICWMYWSYFSLIPDRHDTAALFCARGGLAMRRAFDRYLERTGLSCPVFKADFMVSRLAAIRLTIVKNPSAAEGELLHEPRLRTHADVAKALSGVDPSKDPAWLEPFAMARFEALMRGTESGREVARIVEEQARLLRRHIDDLRGDRTALLLCDTGLFGSTGAFLQAGAPDIDWTSVMIARANYKRLPTRHFDFTIGLAGEEDKYAPWRIRSSMLRYWHLFESLFEPDLESVQLYRETGNGGVICNLETPGWEERLKPTPGGLMAGAMSYLDTLSPETLGDQPARSRAAWVRLKRSLTRPNRADIAALDVGERSFDFGLDASQQVIPGGASGGRARRRPRLAARPGLIRDAFWREGAIRSLFPVTAPALLAGVEAAHTLRAARQVLRERL